MLRSSCLILGWRFQFPFQLFARSRNARMGSLPDQQRRAANEQTCFFGNKKNVRIWTGRCLLLCLAQGGKGVTSFHLFRSEGELVRDIFLGWEVGWGCAVWKRKVRQAELYTCANILQSKAAEAAGRGSSKLNCVMPTIRRREKGQSAPGSACRAAMAQVVPGYPLLWPSSEQTQRNAFASWSDYRESKRAQQQQEWKV